MPKISVIIPCYNPDMKLLKRCLNSIKEQSFSDYEVIIVDDGNTETVKQSMIRICQDDNRFSILSQKNAGVSAARNAGTAIATGKYITYLDADDYFSNSFLLESYNYITENNVDLVIGGVVRVNDQGENILKENYFQTSIFSEKEGFDVIEKNGFETILLEKTERIVPFFIGRLTSVNGTGYINRAVHAKLIKKELALQNPFDKTFKIQEDLVWLLELLKKAKNILFVNTIWYNYYDNSDSVTNKFDETIIEKMEAPLLWILDNVDLSDNKLKIAYRYNLLWSLGIISKSLINNDQWDVSLSEKKEVIRSLYKNKPWIFLKENRIYFGEYYKDIIKIVFYRLKLFFRYF